MIILSHTLRLTLGIAALGCTLAFTGQVFASTQTTPNCTDVPADVVKLTYGSRYADGSRRKDVVNAALNASVNKALAPVDDFIRVLAREANRAGKARGRGKNADCAIGMLVAWAMNDSLSELASKNAKLTIAARLAGIILSYAQVSPHANANERKVIDRWLRARLHEQMTYWDSGAPRNARRGNLKAWAALAVVAGADRLRDADLFRWGKVASQDILCTIDADGAIPREMERGTRALHYQIHALSPLVTSVAILEKNGIAAKGMCGRALERAVHFVVRDINSSGALSKVKSGKSQSYFTGADSLKAHHVAFGAPYLAISKDREFAFWIRKFGTLNNSKLGGDQRLLWPSA